jgi:hypothetical protein
MTKPIDSLKTITRYIEAKKPTTLTEAEHMLNLISVIADETIREIEAEPPFGLSAGTGEVPQLSPRPSNSRPRS